MRKGENCVSMGRKCKNLLPIFIIVLLTVALGILRSNAQSDLTSAGTNTGMVRAEIEEIKNREEKEGILDISYEPNNLINAGTYGFMTGADALEDMSSGTTQLVAASSDDTASAVTNIGFDYWFDGVRYTQFSVNANGLMRFGSTVVNNGASGRTNDFATTTDNPKVSAYWDDLCTSSTGKVHYKVIGSPGSRRLIVEWQNMVTFGTSCTTGLTIGTFQVWVDESSSPTTPGAVHFAYGNLGANSSLNGGYSAGIGSSSTSFASITTATDTVSYATSANAQINTITAPKSYLFTPNVPNAPSGLNFTAITATSLTVNWTDNSSNEVGFAVYRSTDGTNYTFAGQTAADATSFMDAGLTPSTNYFYRVYAVSEGALSSALSGSQMSGAPGNDTCNGAGGNWSSPGTWTDGSVPTAGDNVTIGSGCTVTIDVASSAINVTVQNGGILQFEQTTARTLTASGNVTVDSGGNFSSNAAGTVTTHVLSVGGNLTNNGTLDFSTNTDTAGAGITFAAGAANVSFSGTGATTDVRTITVAKGAQATIVELNTTNFTVRGVSTDVAGYLTITSGTFKISGTFTITNRTFAVTTTYTIATLGGIWLNNPNYTVAATASGSGTTNNGLLRVTQGTYNIGIGAGDQMRGGTGAFFTFEGGTINVSGAFDPQSAVTYNQSGGTLNVGVVGNSVSNFGTFELFSTTSTFIMSGGTINVINPSTGTTKVDYRNNAPTANTNITGGTVVIGATGAPSTSIYNVSGQMPSTTVNSTQTMRVNNATVFMRGSTVNNNGTIDFTGTSARYDFGNVNGAMTYNGPGAIGSATTPFGGVGISANSLFTITLNGPIFTNRVNLFTGGFVNSNQITLGNGGTSTTVVQTGSTGLTTAGGSFDVSPVHNQGSGGEIIIYAFETVPRTTGFEINPTRSLTTLTIDNSGVVVNGGDLTVTGVMTLTNGIVTTGANTLINNGTAARTNGYVDGNLSRSYTATGSYTYFVGQNGFSPVAATISALGTNPSSLTVKPVDNTLPGLTPANSASRYWTLTEGGDLTADLAFTYLDADVNGTETDYRLWKLEMGMISNQCPGSPCVNDATNTATITGVTNFSDWGIGEAGAGTPGTLALSNSTYSVNENVTPATITVNRTGGSAGTVTVDYATSNGTATGGASCTTGVDYISSSGTLTFLNGETSKTFNITICDDAAFEGDETVNVSISNATGGATLGTPNTAVLTIVEDDPNTPANVIVNPGNGNYATLKDAFDAINAGTHTGALTVQIAGDTTETASASLNASGSGAASYTSVSITPTGARTISGSISGDGMIILNGADNVTIDGLNMAGNSLTISNTNSGTTSGTSTIRFIGGATNNTVTNSTVLGSFSGSLATNGGNIFFSTDANTANGNDDNTISNCNIGPAGANLPTKLIYGNGSVSTAAIRNSGVVINNNNLYDYFSATTSVSGMHILSGNDNWTISNNRIYQTAARTFTGTALRYAGITINSTTTGLQGVFTITGNKIGFGASDGTGTTTISGSTNEFRGIDAISVNATTPTSIQGNTISGINQTTARNSTTSTSSAFVGMMLGTTAGRFDVGTTTGNNIGSLDGSSTIVINGTSTTASTFAALGIYDFSVSSNTISNNNIGSFTIQGAGTVLGFRGIYINTGTALTATISNNTIANITDTQVGSYALHGIYVSLAAANVTGNTVRDFSGASTGASLIIASGMLITNTTSTNPSTISRNTVYNLTNSSGSASNSIYAIYCNFPSLAANLVSRNSVRRLSVVSTATTSQMVGILPVAGSATYQNNMVRLGNDAAGNPITTGYVMYGMFEVAGTNNIYHNSVYLGGTGVTAPGSTTFAFVSNVNTGTRNYLNNIFYNGRSNAVSGGAAHVALGLNTGLTGLTSNYNDLYAPGTDGIVGSFNATAYPTLAAWQTATSQDANSKSVDPVFVSSTDLHIQATSPMINMGTATSVTDDFDGDTRDAMPDIGADETMGVVTMPGTLAFSSATYSVGEGVGTTTITVNRTGGSDGTVTVNFATSNGTATGGASCTAGIDYVSTSGTLTFLNGETSKTFNVTICDDSTDEPDETINYTLSNPTGGATLGTPNTAIQTIVDNDEPTPGFTFTISDVRLTEGNSGTTNATFNVTLTSTMPPLGETLASVQYATANGTATAGSDYTATSGTLNFPTTGTMTINVPVIGDMNKEANETFYVNLSNPSPNASITDSQGVGIIIDEDRAYTSDFDRDLLTDFSIFRPSEGNWYVLQSTNGVPKIVNLGLNGDVAVPGDYDGDGLADYAVWRPSDGTWYIIRSSDSGLQTFQWGVSGDKPVQGDYDGDGKTDYGIFRPSTGTWWIIYAGGGSLTLNFGISTDKPVQGDYDGDAKTDIAVYRDGTWYILRSSDVSVQISNWGISTDKPVPSDFDGDGKYDLAIYRNGQWWILSSLTGNFSVVGLGISTDIPAAGDYDGDGTSDIAVFRPSTGDWYVILSSTSALTGVHWGSNGDVPVPSAYLPQ